MERMNPYALHDTVDDSIRAGTVRIQAREQAHVVSEQLCRDNLEGRAQVRFVIGRDGSVSNVQNGGSDLPDSGVINCVINAYYGLSFPQPEGGIVTVVYPIMFQPG